MCQQLASTLGVIVCEGRFSVRELADAGKCSVNAIHQAISNPDRNLTFVVAKRLSRFLSKNGDNRFAKLFIDPSYIIKPAGDAKSNGIIDDEITDLVKIAGNIAHAFETRDDKKMEYYIGAFDKLGLRIRSELGNLRA